MTETDSELIARVLTADDRAAFGKLVLRHQSSVRRFLRHLAGGDAGRADDLAQEVFIEAYRSLSRFRGEARFTTWLFGIAHNLNRNARRREKTARTAEALPDGGEDPAPPPSHSVALNEDMAQALEKLSRDEQIAVHLFYHQDLSQQEIAEVTRWPLGTVKTHLARAREKLRSLLRVWNPQT